MWRRGLCAACVAAGVLSAGGCATGGEPPTRVGALPFPGLLSLYEASDPLRLGRHHSSGSILPMNLGAEGARGIVYTRDAGFLDIAHIRESIDWTRYCYLHIRPLMEAGGGSFRFQRDDARFTVRVEPGGACADPDEPARAYAAHLAYVVMTWHEIASWYGVRAVFFISEQRSCFTWDDTSSHIVGVRLGEELLRDGAEQWDRRVTDALPRRLAELGAADPGATTAAAEAVRGWWWEGASPMKRDLDLGLPGGTKHAWLVDGAPGAGVLRAPVAPEREEPLVRFEIRPEAWLARAMSLDAGRKALRSDEDVLDAVSHLRGLMREKFGEGVDDPAAPVRRARR